MAGGRRRLPFAYRLVVGILRPILLLITRRDWRGMENLPAEGFIACPNHVSYADPITVAHYLIDQGREPYYLTKEAMFRAPGAGWIVRSARQIPVYRESGKASDAFRAAVAAVHEGKCVAIYPDGTLTRDPDLWPMVGKTGAARVALSTKAPVIPIAQWGAQQILPRYSKRPRFFPRSNVTVVAGPPVVLDDLYDRPQDAATLREATSRIVAAIVVLLEEIRGERAPALRFDVRQAGLPPTGRFTEPGDTGQGS